MPTNQPVSERGNEAGSVEAASIADATPVTVPARDNSPARRPNRVTLLQAPEPRADNFNNWLITAVLVLLGIFTALVMIDKHETGSGRVTAANTAVPGPQTRPAAGPDQDPDQPKELPESVRQQLIEAGNLRASIQRLKQLEIEHQQALDKAEALERERDEALAKARTEEKLRAREAELARQAARREKAAAAAAVAAEEALQAEKRANELAEQKWLEDAQRERAQLAQQAREREEREQQELEQAQERARLEQAALVQKMERERLQRQEREQARNTQQSAVTTDAPPASQTRAEKGGKENDIRFSTDPCSGPSAKFLSSCR